ncbi:MAG: class I SAM-dependent methyltransferase [Hyphomicrobiales bacterium]|nr:class I SAM-dependent methyltransferase [Hyphomicrobiales bacterium]
MGLAATSTGAFGSGLACGPDGRPLRPGGPELTETLLDLARFAPGGLVVDVGCGQGGGVAALARRGFAAIGVDRDPAALARARGRVAEGIFFLADAGALPFSAGTIDGVLSECSLSTLPDRRRALGEWARVLTPGGRLALSDVYSRESPRGEGGTPSPVRTRAEVLAELAAAGFVVERFEDRSDVLQAWVARFVFEYGSLDALSGGACGLDVDALGRASPGYFVAIAERRIALSETRP